MREKSAIKMLKDVLTPPQSETLQQVMQRGPILKHHLISPKAVGKLEELKLVIKSTNDNYDERYSPNWEIIKNYGDN